MSKRCDTLFGVSKKKKKKKAYESVESGGPFEKRRTRGGSLFLEKKKKKKKTFGVCCVQALAASGFAAASRRAVEHAYEEASELEEVAWAVSRALTAELRALARRALGRTGFGTARARHVRALPDLRSLRSLLALFTGAPCAEPVDSLGQLLAGLRATRGRVFFFFFFFFFRVFFAFF